jgi:hypothetical protein
MNQGSSGLIQNKFPYFPLKITKIPEFSVYFESLPALFWPLTTGKPAWGGICRVIANKLLMDASLLLLFFLLVSWEKKEERGSETHMPTKRVSLPPASSALMAAPVRIVFCLFDERRRGAIEFFPSLPLPRLFFLLSVEKMTGGGE